MSMMRRRFVCGLSGLLLSSGCSALVQPAWRFLAAQNPDTTLALVSVSASAGSVRNGLRADPAYQQQLTPAAMVRLQEDAQAYLGTYWTMVPAASFVKTYAYQELQVLTPHALPRFGGFSMRVFGSQGQSGTDIVRLSPEMVQALAQLTGASLIAVAHAHWKLANESRLSEQVPAATVLVAIYDAMGRLRMLERRSDEVRSGYGLLDDPQERWLGAVNRALQEIF